MTDEWYQEFPRSMEIEEIFEIVAAANFMTIKPLLDLACLWVTFEMQGKSVQEVSFCLVPAFLVRRSAKRPLL